MKILVLNAGSSSLKYSLYIGADTHLALHGNIDNLTEDPEQELGKKTHEEALLEVEAKLKSAGYCEHLGDCDVIGHRVVQGGEAFHEATIIDEEVIETLEELCQLAPLHNPINLIPIYHITERFPNLTQVAVFDTSFHLTMPDYAYRYAIPNDLYHEHHIRRYGFHGTSHLHIAKQLAETLEMDLESISLISMHLGNGASACAIEYGESIDTSMGFTPLEGLIMGTRSGNCDPAIPLYLIRELGYTADEADYLLNHESGLKGLCGISDMRSLVEAAASGHHEAEVALDMFTYRLNKVVGSYLAVMDEVDALVFTGGIGENSALVRERVLDGFSTRFGIEIDYAANEEVDGISLITTENSEIAVWVIPTDEELEIAQQVIETLIPDIVD
ncbi:MAG: acetate kinase [Thiotrichales bacterium]|nr:acetate kinase [Thiotrichales bacterium]